MAIHDIEMLSEFRLTGFNHGKEPKIVLKNTYNDIFRNFFS